MRIRKRVWFLGALALLVGSGITATQLRYRRHFESDGWVLESSHAWLGCPTCTGRMESFTFRGQPVPLPPRSVSRLELYTPVGHVSYFDASTGYRPYAPRVIEFPESDDVISADDLARGFYELECATSQPTPASAPVERTRKRGTPPGWLVAQSEDHLRCLDPMMIGRLEW